MCMHSCVCACVCVSVWRGSVDRWVKETDRGSNIQTYTGDSDRVRVERENKRGFGRIGHGPVLFHFDKIQ